MQNMVKSKTISNTQCLGYLNAILQREIEKKKIAHQNHKIQIECTGRGLCPHRGFNNTRAPRCLCACVVVISCVGQELLIRWYCSSRTPSQASDRSTKENKTSCWSLEKYASFKAQSHPLLRLPLVGLTLGNNEFTGDAPRSGMICFPVRERFFSFISLCSCVRSWSFTVETWKVVSF